MIYVESVGDVRDQPKDSAVEKAAVEDRVHGDAVAATVGVGAAGDRVDVGGEGRAEDNVEEPPVGRDLNAVQGGD